MNRETRIESYRKIYAHLKEVKGLPTSNIPMSRKTWNSSSKVALFISITAYM